MLRLDNSLTRFSGDSRYLKLDGSNANTNISIGLYGLTAAYFIAQSGAAPTQLLNLNDKYGANILQAESGAGGGGGGVTINSSALNTVGFAVMCKGLRGLFVDGVTQKVDIGAAASAPYAEVPVNILSTLYVNKNINAFTDVLYFDHETASINLTADNVNGNPFVNLRRYNIDNSCGIGMGEVGSLDSWDIGMYTGQGTQYDLSFVNLFLGGEANCTTIRRDTSYWGFGTYTPSEKIDVVGNVKSSLGFKTVGTTATGKLLTNGATDQGMYCDFNNIVRFSGSASAVTMTGAGMEFFYYAGAGYMQAYDRTNSVYLPLNYVGTIITINGTTYTRFPGSIRYEGITANQIPFSGALYALAGSNSLTFDGATLYTYALTVGSGYVGQYAATLTNTDTGTGSLTEWQIRNAGSVNNSLRLMATGVNWTTAGGFVQNSGVIDVESNLTGGLNIMTRAANSTISFYPGTYNVLVATLTGTGLGIGIAAPTSKLHIVDTSTNTYGFTLSKTTTDVSLQGGMSISSIATVTADQTAYDNYGMIFGCYTATGLAFKFRSLYGIQGFSYHNGVTDLTSAFGAKIGCRIGNSGNVASFTGLNIASASSGASASGVVTNNYDIFISDYALSGGGTGRPINNYHLYMATPAQGTTLNWQIYSVGGNSAFGGSTRFGGVTAPVVACDITGSGRASTSFQTSLLDSSYTAATDLTITCGTAKTLALTTVVYEDVQFGVSGAKVPAANYPTWETFTANTNEYSFTVNDYIDAAANEVPHSWVEGTKGDAHLHLAIKTAQNAGADRFAKFSLTFSISDPSQAGTKVWTELTALIGEVTIPNGAAALTGYYLDMGDLTLTGYKVGTQVKVRIKRIAATGGTEYGANVFITQCGVHFQKDTIGSRTETVK